MQIVLPLAALAVVIGFASMPAQASSCAEQIGTIERRLDSQGAIRVAGLVTGHSIRGSNSPKALAAAPGGEPSDPEMIPSAQGIAAARNLIRRAVNEDRRGDQRGCQDTMTEAKGKIGALP